MTTKEQWEEWNKERERYRELESQGYEQDIENLTAHIKKLLDIAPKDKAGWMNLNALDVVTQLRQKLLGAKTFFGNMP